MSTIAAQAGDIPRNWSASAPHVRKMIGFVKKRGHVTADELVEWDRTHGRLVFDWNDASAAEDWRQHQARVFLNTFRRMFDGMRVRAFIHVSEDAEEDIGESAYVTVEQIAEHPGMRAQVVEDITRRMKMLASELRMWKLTEEEQRDLFRRLAEAMRGETARKVA